MKSLTAEQKLFLAALPSTLAELANEADRNGLPEGWMTDGLEGARHLIMRATYGNIEIQRALIEGRISDQEADHLTKQHVQPVLDFFFQKYPEYVPILPHFAKLLFFPDGDL